MAISSLRRWSAHLAGLLRRRLLADVLIDQRVRAVPADAAEVWRVATAVGGRKGYPLDWLWRVRGAVDRALAGPGLDRSGPSADEVGVRDRLDFWEVTELDRGRHLRMRGLLKIPGDAELAVTVREGDGVTVFTQTARFWPAGLAGRVY